MYMRLHCINKTKNSSSPFCDHLIQSLYKIFVFPFVYCTFLIDKSIVANTKAKTSSTKQKMDMKPKFMIANPKAKVKAIQKCLTTLWVL